MRPILRRSPVPTRRDDGRHTGRSLGRVLSSCERVHLVFRRVPRDEAFYGLLGRTAAHTLAAARELPALLGATSDAERKAVAKAIADLEGAGDAATHEVIRSATAAFLTPFDRSAIKALVDGAPEITAEQAARIRAVLGGAA